MQSTGIKSAQLLMEVMAGAQEKIGQEISRTGFSQQLSEQNQLIQNVPFMQSANLIEQGPQSGQSSAAPTETASQQTFENSAKLPAGNDNCCAKSTASSMKSVSPRSLVLSKWRTAQELALTDPMALEKVLTQFHLASSAREAIGTALDNQGRISLQKLSSILDRSESNRSELPPDGRVSTGEIQSLLAGMMQQQQFSLDSLKKLGIPQTASCDYREFRGILKRIIDQVAAGTIEQSAKSSLRQSPEKNLTTDKPSTDVPFTSRMRLPNQTQSLTTNMIPSFLGETREPARDTDSSILIEAVSVSNDDRLRKNRTPAVDEMDPREGLLPGDQRAPQLDKATNAPVEHTDSAAPAPVTSVPLGPRQVPQESISESVLNALSQIVSKAASETTTRTTGEFQPVRIAENSLTPAPKPKSDSPAAGTDSLRQAAETVSGSTASISEALIRALRMGPAEYDPNGDAIPVERTMSDRSSIPAVEKIAAPAGSNATSNQSGSSGDSSFTRDKASLSSTHYAERPLHTLTETVLPPDGPDQSTENLRRVFKDMIQPRIVLSSTRMEERATASDSTKSSLGMLKSEGIEPDRILETSRIPQGVDRTLSQFRPSGILSVSSSDTPVSAGQSTVRPLNTLTDPALPNDVQDQSAETLRAILKDVTRSRIVLSPATQEQSAAVSNSIESPQQSRTVQNDSTPSAITFKNEIRQGVDLTLSQSPSSGLPSFSSNDTPILSSQSAVRPLNTLTGQASPNAVPDQSAENPKEAFRDVTQSRIVLSPATQEQSAAVSSTAESPQQSRTVQNESTFSASANSGRAPQLSSADYGDLPPAGNNSLSRDAFEPQTIQDMLPRAAMERNIPGLTSQGVPAEPVAAASNTADSTPGQADARKPSITASLNNTDSGSGIQGTSHPETLPGGARPNNQNNVELLADNAAATEQMTVRGEPSSREAVDQATRSTTIETGESGMDTEKLADKATPRTFTGNQFDRHERGRDDAFSLYRDGVPMTSVPTVPAAQKAAEAFAGYSSSLTAELAQKIQEMTRQRQSEFILELQPASLGRLVVRVGTDANRVKALISTDSEQVRELLSRNAPQLRQELASQGLVLGQLQIDVNSQAAAQEQFFQKQGTESRRNGWNQKFSTHGRGATEPPPIRRAQISQADNLISVFV
jgi:flagellar hook-length control protein FliK